MALSLRSVPRSRFSVAPRDSLFSDTVSAIRSYSGSMPSSPLVVHSYMDRRESASCDPPRRCLSFDIREDALDRQPFVEPDRDADPEREPEAERVRERERDLDRVRAGVGDTGTGASIAEGTEGGAVNGSKEVVATGMWFRPSRSGCRR